ncbi:MAG: hydrogenase nickel incorporation protein HypB [archaeon]
MCDECGCGNVRKFVVNRAVSEANDVAAHRVRHELTSLGVLCVNIMGAPGAGKTTLIERLVRFIVASEMFVIQGDLESDVDSKRLTAAGIACHQINTHSGCHLDAHMIEGALASVDLSGRKYLLIENVGNLVCPAGKDIGQHVNLVVSSTAEGSDKPRKYPFIFMDAGLVVVSKMDLAPYVGFDVDGYISDVRNINGRVKVVCVGSDDVESYGAVAGFIEHERAHVVGHKHGH